MKEILIDSVEQFDEIIKEGVSLVDFYASWCGPCKMLAPFIEEIAEDYDGKAKVCKIDVDNLEELAVRYNISSIPSLMYFKDNKVEKTSVGFQSKETIESVLNSLLEN